MVLVDKLQSCTWSTLLPASMEDPQASKSVKKPQADKTVEEPLADSWLALHNYNAAALHIGITWPCSHSHVYSALCLQCYHSERNISRRQLHQQLMQLQLWIIIRP